MEVHRPVSHRSSKTMHRLYENRCSAALNNKRMQRMSILSNLDLIRRVPLFSTLTQAQAELVANTVVKRRYKRGDIIVEQGKKSNFLAIVLTGRTRVITTDSRGREVILATMQPGDYIGEMSLIDNQPHSATVRAEIQTDVLILGRAEFARCLPENSSMAYAVMRGLVQRCWTCTAAWLALCWSSLSQVPRATQSFASVCPVKMWPK